MSGTLSTISGQPREDYDDGKIFLISKDKKRREDNAILVEESLKSLNCRLCELKNQKKNLKNN